MALVSHISPRVAEKLHTAGLLSEAAKVQIERRNKLVRRAWVLVAVIFALTLLGAGQLLGSSHSAKSVPVKQVAR